MRSHDRIWGRCRYGATVSTPDFQSGNTGSIPVSGTKSYTAARSQAAMMSARRYVSRRPILTAGTLFFFNQRRVDVTVADRKKAAFLTS